MKYNQKNPFMCYVYDTETKEMLSYNVPIGSEEDKQAQARFRYDENGKPIPNRVMGGQGQFYFDSSKDAENWYQNEYFIIWEIINDPNKRIMKTVYNSLFQTWEGALIQLNTKGVAFTNKGYQNNVVGYSITDKHRNLCFFKGVTNPKSGKPWGDYVKFIQKIK